MKSSRELLRRASIGALADMMARRTGTTKQECQGLAELAYSNLRPRDSDVFILTGPHRRGRVGEENLWEWLGQVLHSVQEETEITITVRCDAR